MPPTTNAVTTEEEFRRRLAALVAEARANDVHVEGGWSCRLETEESDYEALITEIAPRSGRRDAPADSRSRSSR